MDESTTAAERCQISAELGIRVVTFYSWIKARRLEGEVVPVSQKYQEGWGPAEKFTVGMETAGLTTTELSAYCRERCLYPQQVVRWRQASEDAMHIRCRPWSSRRTCRSATRRISGKLTGRSRSLTGANKYNPG